MKPNEGIHEVIESINVIQEIQEIDAVTSLHPNSVYFDRLHAQVIIKKYLDTDPCVIIANAVLPNRVPLEQATNELLWIWLDAIKKYLIIKRESELMCKLHQNDNNSG